MRLSRPQGILRMLALVWSGSLSVGIGDGTAEEPRSSGVIPGSYSGSAANLQDRAAEQLLRDAQRDFDSGDTVSGVRRLQELFNRGRESFLLIDGVYRPADDAAAVLLQRGPPLHRETYERLFGPVARQDLDQALSVDDRADIHRVARKFRFTAAGSRAGLALAVRAWDRGDRDLAAEWWRHVNEWNARDVAPERSGSVYAQIAQFVRDAVNGDTGRDAPGTSFPQVRVELTAARWRRDVPMTDAARQEIAVSLAELDAQAILPLMPARPLIRGGVAYWRPLESIAAVNLQTGDVLWEYAVPTHVSSLIREDRDFENSIRRSSSTAVFLERLVRSSLVDQLSTDGTHLFAVIANPSPRQIPAGDPNAPPPPPPKNELVALSLQDGRPLWRTGPADGWGARKQAAEPAAENDSAETDMTRIDPGAALEDVFFMGPPQPFGHWRIVIGQKDRTVFVLALDARNGKLGWSVPLGRVAQGLWDDKPRHGTACPVTIHNGRAYCPTACGCFACVDLVTRRLLWAFRYPRDDLARSALSPERFRPDTTHASNLPTREQWHEVFVHIGKGEGGGGGGGTVVFSSPDTGRMFGLEARTGRVQWSRPRERGLFAVGLDDERVLVVAADEAIARSISDGKTLWRTGISRPSGTGFLTGTEYVFPTEAGGLQRVGRVDGATQLDFARGDDLPRAEVGGRHVAISVGPPPRLRPVSMHNLVAADGMVLVQSFDRLTAVPLGNLENSEEPVQSPDVARDNQTADPEHFPGWSWPVDEDRLGEWTSALRVARFASPSFGAVQSALSTARQLQPLMRASNDRAAELLEELAETFHGGDGAPEDSAPADAILRRLMRQPLDELYVRLDNPRRSVRLDRWLESGFAEMATGDPQQRLRIQGAVTRHLQKFDRSVFEGRAAGAPPVSLVEPSGQTDPVGSPWPEGKPTVSEHPPHGGNLYVINVPMTVIADSPWEQVTVQVDRQERNLWFHRADRAAPITMPLSRSPESPETMGGMVHAWADGPLLCVRVGTDLTGFWMTEDAAELPTAPLWPARGTTLSVTGVRPPLFMGLAEATDDPLPRWDDSIPSYYDNFWRPLGVIGPVRETYLCFQDRGILVAVDPATGRELWSRAGLPVGTYCVGDDDHIVLLRDEGGTIEVLRTSDGAAIAAWDWPPAQDADPQPAALFSRIVSVRGTLALWHSHPPQLQGLDPERAQGGVLPAETTAAVIDLSSGRKLWSRNVPSGSWVFGIDNRLTCSLSPDGTFVLWDWATGDAVAQHRPSVPRQMTDLFVMHDAATAFIVASDRPHDKRLLGATQIRGAERRPIVNGWMHAIDRSDGRHLWECELSNIGLILDQPRHVPLLVTAYMMQDGQRNRSAGVLRSYDRRTGELLDTQLRVQPLYMYHAVRADAAHSRVEVDTSEKTIRFQYPANK